ncbi:MAG: hypothetical protein E7559_07520 [Ruminococcaceae bacterium]|nr:hypothetical protein [Oscillospiraceae bacterium]
MKRLIMLLLAMVLVLYVSGCTYRDSRDSGSYTTDRALCWIKHDTHYEKGSPVNIAELYVTSFDGKSYDYTAYSLNDVFTHERGNWKIVKNPLSDNDTLHIANFSDWEIDIARFTLSAGFAEETEHYSLPCNVPDHAAATGINDVFALTDEYIYFTATEAADSICDVAVCRYSIADSTTELLTSYTVAKSYYSAPALSPDGDILFIAEALGTEDETYEGSSLSARKTYLYTLSQGETELIDEARLAVWSDGGAEIIYQPLDTQFMLYDTEKKTTSVYVDKTHGRNSRCDSFAVCGDDIAYWANQDDLYIRDGIFTWTQMVPDGIKLVVTNRKTDEEMVIIGYDDFKQFDYVDSSRLVWLEQA